MLPKIVRERKAEQEKGIEFDRYVPEGRRKKFKRLRVAKAAGRDPEELADLLFDELIELSWLSNAEVSAVSDYQKQHAKD